MEITTQLLGSIEARINSHGVMLTKTERIAHPDRGYPEVRKYQIFLSAQEVQKLAQLQAVTK